MLSRQHVIKVRKRFKFSYALEKGLGKEMEGWEFCWETQVGDAFPVLRGGTEACGRKYDRLE